MARFGQRWCERLIGVMGTLDGDLLGTFIDMSQSHAPCDTTLVVACVSTLERWNGFRGAWQEALAPFGRNVFHTTQYVAGITTGRGPYGRLKKDAKRRRAFERRLTRIVRAHVIVNVLEAIPEQDHRAMASYLRAREPVQADSYYFCLSMCLLRIQVPVRPAARGSAALQFRADDGRQEE